jgi:tellurite methyltransferase
MAELPTDVRAYRRTPEFTQDTIPAGLLRQHSTKPGVWGRIVVLEGTLTYRVPTEGTTARLSPTCVGIVVPEVLHEVEATGPVRFYVEFLRR